MISLDVVTLPTISHRADQVCFEGPIVVCRVAFAGLGTEVVGQADHIEDGCGEMCNVFVALMGDIARHGERFEVDLGPHHCTADIEHHATFELCDCVRQNQKVIVTCLPEGSAVTIWVLVDDILADADMYCHGYTEAMTSCGNGEVFVGKVMLFNHTTHILTQTEIVGGCL